MTKQKLKKPRWMRFFKQEERSAALWPILGKPNMMGRGGHPPDVKFFSYGDDTTFEGYGFDEFVMHPEQRDFMEGHGPHWIEAVKKSESN